MTTARRLSRRLGLYAFTLIGAASTWWSSPDSVLSARTGAVPFWHSRNEPLSILTYNVHGLPWPIASNRSKSLRRIGDRLAALRRMGLQPSIVVLQEAFTTDAKDIGARAGYRFIIEGPSRDLASRIRPDSRDEAFAAQAHWFKGEQIGTLYDSGLVVLSDLPVLDVKRAAFPHFSCAGYDCLANKGALLVTVNDELTGHRVQIVTSHLNSRHSSYVPEARSFYAYRRQVEELTRFIQFNHLRDAPLIVAGDFNASSRERRTTLLRAAAMWNGDRLAPVQNVLDHCSMPAQSCGGPPLADVAFARHYGRDWQFYVSGSSTRLEPIGLSVPFGHEHDGTMLSDHVGYTALYRIEQDGSAQTAQRVPKSKEVAARSLDQAMTPRHSRPL